MDGCASIEYERRSSVYKSSLTKSERTCRLASVIAGELLVFLTLIILITKKEYTHLAMCIGSFAMVWLPIIIELLFSCKMNTAMYIFGELYALSPLFGECYKLYYLTSWWDITVLNDGEEIPEDAREKIFNKFYQADESHATEGNGVGLAVVKKIVDLHGGNVSVSCADGRTAFTVSLLRKG